MKTDILIFLIFLTPALASLIWPIRTVLSSRPVLLAKWDLSAMQFLISIAITFYAANNYGLIAHPYIGDVIYTVICVFTFPFYYMFLCELTRPYGATVQDRRGAFLPPILYCIIFIILVFNMGDEKYALYVDRVLVHKDYTIMHDFNYDAMHLFGYWAFEFFLLLQMIVFVTSGFFRLRRYRSRLEAYSPALMAKAKNAFMVAGLVFLSCLIITYIVLNPYPTTVGEMGITYFMLILFSSVQFLIGQYADNLDISVKQMLMVKRDSDVLSNSKPKQQ